MKRLVNCILALPVCMGLTACALASEIVWKGGDGMPDWNDDATWEGGKRPLAGDMAVIPDGAEALAGNVDYAYINTLAGIRIEKGGTLTITNLSGSIEHRVPLSGEGLFRGVCTKDDIDASVILNSDNKDFTGEFQFEKCGVTVKTATALGAPGCRLTYQGNARIRPAGGIDNRVCKYNTGNATTSACVEYFGGPNEYTTSSDSHETLTGTHVFHAPARVIGSGVWRFVFLDNDVSYDGPPGNALICQSTYFKGAGTLDMGEGTALADYRHAAADVFAIRLGKKMISGRLADQCGWICLLDRENVCEKTIPIAFVPYSTSYQPRLELQGGFDQQCGNFECNANVTDGAVITASDPATLTVHGTAANAVKAILTGKLSLTLDSDNDEARPGVFDLVSPGHTTTGTLTAKRGTMTLGAETTFPNVTALVAMGSGKLIVNTANLNSKATLTASGAGTLEINSTLGQEAVLCAADEAKLVINSIFNGQSARLVAAKAENLELNSEVSVYTAQVGGAYLPSGTLDASSGYFTGRGRLTVLSRPIVQKDATYVGMGADIDFSSPANWADGQVPANLAETIVHLGGAGSPERLNFPAEGGQVYGLVVKADRDLTLAGGQVAVGAAGVVCEAPAEGTMRTHRFEMPLEVVGLPQSWTVPTNVSLTIAAPLSGVKALELGVTISGGGGLVLDADSPDLEPPLALDGLALKINKPFALGSTNRFTLIKAAQGTSAKPSEKKPSFANGLRNEVPIGLSGSWVYYLTEKYDETFTQSGEARLNGVWVLGNGTCTFEGGLSGEGLFYTVSSTYTITGQPMNMPKGALLQDNTTLYVGSTGNVFEKITQGKGVTVCLTNDALCATGVFAFGGDGSATLDLGGFDQEIGGLQGAVPGAITSARPAVLTSYDAADRTLAVSFGGLAGYAHAGAGTYTFTQPSDTKGSLSVLSGGVKLDAGASFGAVSNVTVAAGAKLVVSVDAAAAAFSANGRSRATLALSTDEGASSELALEGGTVTVSRLVVNGEPKPMGTYDRTSGIGITGEGTLRVLRPSGLILFLK